MSMKVRKKEKSPFMKDGTCRCCNDKRSKAVDGVLGKAHTKCVHQRGKCIGHENESDGLQVMDKWMRPGPSRMAAPIEETEHVSEPAVSSVQPVAVCASSSSCPTACGAAASFASTDTASTETAASTAASSAAASTETAASTDTASTAAASTVAAAAPAAVSFTSSPSRRSARAGGAYGATAIAERRSPSKAAADHQLKALKAELAAAVAELETYKSEREQSAAMAAARAAEVDASVMQAQVDAHLSKLIAKRIADAATHNTSHSIGTPHVAAAITATFAHARARATGPPLSPSRQLMTIVFEAPKALDPDEFMLQMGAKHSILDWREFGQHAFWCSTCKEMSMRVAKTDPDPDGLVRDKYSCTANGALGLCKLSGGDAPWTLASPKLVCTSPCCRHKDCMHSETVLQHIPPKLLGHYPCDLPWIKGVQEHVVRSFTTRIESLYVPPTDDL